MKCNFNTGRNIRIAISSYCNLDCSYCGGHKGFTKEKMGAMEDYRREPLNGYQISINEIKKLLRMFYAVGFRGITLTGGEPLVNKSWYEIIKLSKEIGFLRREITTNGVLLSDYIKKDGFPNDLTLIKISLDTINANIFREITGKDDFLKVVESIKLSAPKIETRINRVVLKSELNDLDDFLKYCQKLRVSSINLLDLVYYPNKRIESDRLFFENEYVSANDIKKHLEEKNGYSFERNKYGYQSSNVNSLKIIIKESRFTLRDDQCKKCPIYCQEGKFTVRIATDGNITICPDFFCEVDSLSGRELLSGSRSIKELQKLYNDIDNAIEYDTLDEFFEKNNLKVRS